MNSIPGNKPEVVVRGMQKLYIRLSLFIDLLYDGQLHSYLSYILQKMELSIFCLSLGTRLLVFILSIKYGHRWLHI